MTGQLYQVLVSEQRNHALVGADGLSSNSPPHTEADARVLIALLNGGLTTGAGPWRHPIAGGQRTIHLVKQEQPTR